MLPDLVLPVEGHIAVMMASRHKHNSIEGVCSSEDTGLLSKPLTQSAEHLEFYDYTATKENGVL
jgi:hypothetical protein